MKEKERKKKGVNLSLSTRLPLIFIFSGMLSVLIVMPLLYFQLEKRMVREYTGRAQSLIKLLARDLDGGWKDDYFELFSEANVFAVFQMQDGENQMIYEVGRNGENAEEVFFEDKQVVAYLKKICIKQKSEALISHTKKGYRFVYAECLADEEEEYRCHICVEFMLDSQRQQDILFVIRMFAIFGEIVLVISLADIYVVRRRITGPIDAIAKCTNKFTYETEEDRYHNVQMMEELNIQTGDEIQNMYYTFMSVMKECLFYMSSLSRAQDNIQEQEEMLGQISKTAFRDALTGVGNQAAYNQVAEKLTQDIENKTAEFAIVMVDVNNLKFINDTYGHKMGDSYIRGCCSMICNIYKRSPVFRIGGDEFIVVLQNEDYACRLLRLTQMSEMFKGSYTQKDREDWERYSVSAGMAEYTADDKTVEQVQKRADAEMYANKMRFKKKFGSYR